MQGSRTYIWNLAARMPELAPGHQFVFYVPPAMLAQPEPAFVRDNVTLVEAPDMHNRIARLLFGFPKALRRDRIDVFHSQYIAPVFQPCPQVVTIHDIIHEIHPEFYPPRLRRMMSASYPFSARRARLVITDSEYSRGLIEKLYRVSAERLRMIPLGVAPEFKPVTDAAVIDRACAAYGIERPYMLFVGRIEPRKNLAGLIEAYRTMSGAPRHSLVVAGMQDDLFPQHHADILRRGGAAGVHFTGPVAQEHLPAILSAAELFVYPSFAEGFGLPVLEAMACGTPVITTTAGSIPEVAGNACVLVDPARTYDLAARMSEVIGNPERLAAMREDGLARARLFDWESAARATLSAYETAAGGRSA